MVYRINIALCVFQSPIDYGSLKTTRKHRIQADGEVRGMCYFSGKLHIVTGLERYTLQVYSVNDQHTITLLGTWHMPVGLGQPRVDHQSGRVYIPRYADGVLVVKYDGSKLLIVSTLRCVRDVSSLAIVSPDTLYVFDNNDQTVCLVDVIHDRVTWRLQKPRSRYFRKWKVAFLGETLIVGHRYGDSLVKYRHGASTPGKVINSRQRMCWVGVLTTDNHSSFLLIGGVSSIYHVYVLDISGDLTHTIPIVTDSEPVDCTVVGKKLWVVCDNGGIIVMSSL